MQSPKRRRWQLGSIIMHSLKRDSASYRANSDVCMAKVRAYYHANSEEKKEAVRAAYAAQSAKIKGVPQGKQQC